MKRLKKRDLNKSIKDISLDEKIARIRLQNEETERHDKMIEEDIAFAERNNAGFRSEPFSNDEESDSEMHSSKLYSDRVLSKNNRSTSEDEYEYSDEDTYSRNKQYYSADQEDTRWRNERKIIDDERINRGKVNNNLWKREWDADKDMESARTYGNHSNRNKYSDRNENGRVERGYRRRTADNKSYRNEGDEYKSSDNWKRNNYGSRNHDYETCKENRNRTKNDAVIQEARMGQENNSNYHRRSLNSNGGREDYFDRRNNYKNRNQDREVVKDENGKAIGYYPNRRVKSYRDSTQEINDETRNYHRRTRDSDDETRNYHRRTRDSGDETRNHYRRTRDSDDETRNYHRKTLDSDDETRNYHRRHHDSDDETRKYHRRTRDSDDETRNYYRRTRDSDMEREVHINRSNSYKNRNQYHEVIENEKSKGRDYSNERNNNYRDRARETKSETSQYQRKAHGSNLRKEDYTNRPNNYRNKSQFHEDITDEKSKHRDNFPDRQSNNYKTVTQHPEFDETIHRRAQNSDLGREDCRSNNNRNRNQYREIIKDENSKGREDFSDKHINNYRVRTHDVKGETSSNRRRDYNSEDFGNRTHEPEIINNENSNQRKRPQNYNLGREGNISRRGDNNRNRTRDSEVIKDESNYKPKNMKNNRGKSRDHDNGNRTNQSEERIHSRNESSKTGKVNATIMQHKKKSHANKTNSRFDNDNISHEGCSVEESFNQTSKPQVGNQTIPDAMKLSQNVTSGEFRSSKMVKDTTSNKIQNNDDQNDLSMTITSKYTHEDVAFEGGWAEECLKDPEYVNNVSSGTKYNQQTSNTREPRILTQRFVPSNKSVALGAAGNKADIKESGLTQKPTSNAADGKSEMIESKNATHSNIVPGMQKKSASVQNYPILSKTVVNTEYKSNVPSNKTLSKISDNQVSDNNNTIIKESTITTVHSPVNINIDNSFHNAKVTEKASTLIPKIDKNQNVFFSESNVSSAVNDILHSRSKDAIECPVKSTDGKLTDFELLQRMDASESRVMVHKTRIGLPNKEISCHGDLIKVHLFNNNKTENGSSSRDATEKILPDSSALTEIKRTISNNNYDSRNQKSMLPNSHEEPSCKTYENMTACDIESQDSQDILDDDDDDEWEDISDEN